MVKIIGIIPAQSEIENAAKIAAHKLRKEERKSKKVLIEDWRAYPSRENLKHLIGRVEGHPNQASFNAEEQITSRVVYIDFDNRVAKTQSGTWYTLGKEKPL
jgi:hypothetical protein